MISVEEEAGFFGRLFSPGTVDTDVSGNSGEEDSEFDDSIDSGTIYTDMTGASQSESDGSSEASSTGSTMMRFDRELRAKHRGACKNMTVSVFYCNLLSLVSMFVRSLATIVSTTPCTHSNTSLRL